MSETRRIIHCFRAPVGGLFRHISDLVRVQAGLGHETGIVCDARSGGAAANKRLEELSEFCALGIRRIAMGRLPGPGDLLARRAVRRFARETGADVLHGHGAKGGAYARLVAPGLKRRGQDCLAVYTPHGGALHYGPETLSGRLFHRIERRLAAATDCLIFESEYASKLYEQRLGALPCPTFIVPNGLWPHEFYDTALVTDAADFLFVGELRQLKGVDLFLQALAGLREKRAVTALIVGAGPEEKQFRRMADRLRLANAVTFPGPMPARAAFPRGRCLVVPSRAESLPYIVLEAAAARLPIIASNAGGIPEIMAGADVHLAAPGDAESLQRRMAEFLERPAEFVERAGTLQELVAKRFRAEDMGTLVCEAYERARALNQPG